jgi:predicted Fe-Mo cluster-binding NifX family protein
VYKYDFWDTLYNNQIILFIIIKIIMKKRIAIPLENGVLCSHFGHCKQFAIVDAENNSISGETLVTPPPHEPGLLPAWLAEKGVTDVIAGGMGQRAIDLFNNQKINVFVGAQVKNYSDLANDLINGSLVAGANYCDH